MTNNDDVIVIACKPVRCGVLTTYSDTGQTINLSELAREKLKSIENDLGYTAKEKKGCKQTVIDFLSKIREAIK